MGGAFPYADEAALRAALQIFYASAAYAQLERRYDKYATYTSFLAEGDSGIKALWTAFNSTMPTVRPRHPRTLRAWLQTRRPGGGRSSLVLFLRQNIETSATAISKYYDPWRKAVSDTCNDVAPCMMADGAYYRYMGMTFTLVDTATLNIAIALIVSYFILLIFTGNFLAPVLAIVSIGSTITWVNAAILLMGYKFDLIGAILLVMIVGMSVDYAAQWAPPARLAARAAPAHPLSRSPSASAAPDGH